MRGRWHVCYGSGLSIIIITYLIVIIFSDDTRNGGKCIYSFSRNIFRPFEVRIVENHNF